MAFEVCASNGQTAGPTNALFFTAGINDEANGLWQIQV
jgi:hypothetical protein